jgi:hypothetical protein
MYEPRIGRWISEDPIGFEAGDANLYRYAGNSPQNYIDPTGLEWVWPWDPNANWKDWRLGEAARDAFIAANAVPLNVVRQVVAPVQNQPTQGYIDVQITLPIHFWINSGGFQIGDGPPGPLGPIPGFHPYVGWSPFPGASVTWAPLQEVHPGINYGGGGFAPIPGVPFVGPGAQGGGHSGNNPPIPAQGGFGEIGIGTTGFSGGIWWVW